MINFERAPVISAVAVLRGPEPVSSGFCRVGRGGEVAGRAENRGKYENCIKRVKGINSTFFTGCVAQG